ncbi:MAG: hypothetical protein RRC07_11685 [Anaerolineae bacterium]|nr:hypothetical protein [Anaerolineae bacterium]
MKRSLLLLALFLAAISLLAAPGRAATQEPVAPLAAAGYDPVAELVPPTDSGLSPRDVAVANGFAHVLVREGRLLTYNLSALLAATPAPGAPLLTLDDPDSELALAGYGSGLLANGTIGYAYGRDGIIVVRGLGTAAVTSAREASSRNTYNLIRDGNTLIGVGPSHVTLYSLADPANPSETATRALGPDNTGFSAAVVRRNTLVVGQLASTRAGSTGTTGFAIFAYPSLEPIRTMGDVPVPYHLHAFGAQLVSCTSQTVELWDFSTPAEASRNDLFQANARVCARDGDKIITNGVVLRAGTGQLHWVSNFTATGSQIDGFPYGSAVDDGFVFLAQFTRILVLTRPLPTTAALALAPPRLDGQISRGEWNLSDPIPFAHGFVAAQNDADRLYLLVDVLDDPTPDVGDTINISFDVNRDGQITPGVDVNYYLQPRTRNLRPRYYTGPESFGQDFDDYRSGRALGYSCSLADGTFQLVLQRAPRCDQHVFWELAIDLEEIGAKPGEPVHMGIGIASGSPQFDDRLPSDYLYNFQELLVVDLAELHLPPPDTGPAVPYQVNPLEVTQAVQTRSNTLPLVAQKDTAVRAYLNNSSGATASLTVYLYGSRGTVDLPGSPLTVHFNAPTAVDRDRLAHTANFDLPDSWVGAGTVTLSARSKRWLGASATSSTVTVNFQTRQTPLVWTIPVNGGSAASPSLQAAADMADARSYMQTVYPVPGITYVNKPWTALGANMPTSDALIAELNDYHGTVVLAWIFGFLFGGGTSPFDLPDQIHGFTPSSDGLSDPTWWNNGNGYVSYSGDIFDADLIMAHEVNHNLDRSNTGTWGRHNGGCGSTGPDPNWPYSGNDDVNEVGFDTRAPWVDGVVSDRRTVITSNYPDFMSYCTHANMPGAWISPYRWENLFDNAAIIAPAAAAAASPEVEGPNPATQRMLLAAQEIEEVLYLSGRLGDGGDGELDPVLVEQGIPTPVPAGSQYTIELRGAGGTLLQSISFDMIFEDVEGNPLPNVYFDFRVPNPGGVKSIQLKDGSTPLDEIVVSDNAPQVTIQQPGAGTVWNTSGTIRWTATDPDSGDLRFNLFYSPDNGATWLPIAGDVDAREYTVDTTLLAGSTEAKIRIIATDGFNTTTVDSTGTFTVANQAPLVNMDSPLPGQLFSSGQFIPLQATAHDPEGAALGDENYLWKAGGEVVAFGPDSGVFLPDGAHTITLEVRDDLDNVTTLSVPIVVGSTSLYLPLIRH